MKTLILKLDVLRIIAVILLAASILLLCSCNAPSSGDESSVEKIDKRDSPVLAAQEAVTDLVIESYSKHYENVEVSYGDPITKSHNNQDFQVILFTKIFYDPLYDDIDYQGQRYERRHTFKVDLSIEDGVVNNEELAFYQVEGGIVGYDFTAEGEVKYTLINGLLTVNVPEGTPDKAAMLYIDTMKTGDFTGEFYTDAHGGMSPEPVDGMSLEEAEELGLVEEAANTKHDNTSLFMSQRQFMIDLFGEDVWDSITVELQNYDSNYSTYWYKIYVDGSPTAPSGETDFTFEITDRLGYWSLYDSIQWRTPINPEDMIDI